MPAKRKKNEQGCQPAAPVPDGLLTKEELAVRLGIRPRTVGVWVHQGRLPAYFLGRYLRFKWDEVQQFLASTCHVAGERRGQ